MSEIFSNIAFLMAILCLLWTIIGFVKPRYIIKWAIPEKQTRLRASGFGLSLVFVFVGISYSLWSKDSWLEWIFPTFFAVLTLAMTDFFTHTNKELAERDENNRAESERRRREKEAIQFRENQELARKLRQENMHWVEDEVEDEDALDREPERMRRNEWLDEWKEELSYSFGKKVSSVKEKDLREKFGGDEECLYNFRMYAARLARNENICYVPRSDYYRRRFDVLSRNGVAKKFASFSLELLPLLSMDELRSLGKAAGLNKLKSSKKASCELLSELPDDVLKAAWPAIKMDHADFFQLKGLNEL